MRLPFRSHPVRRRPRPAGRARTGLALAAVVAACGVLAFASVPASGGATGARAKTRTVIVGSNFYSPSRLTIRRGDRVRWVWRGGMDRHDVNVRRGPERFNSPTQTSGTYTRRFRRPGTFRLYCTQHRMFMTLKVRR